LIQTRTLALKLLPVLITVGVVFLVTGASLATLPLYVHTRLGFGADVVGAVAGAQFVAALLSRLWAGRSTDRRGPKHTLLVGLAMAILAGCFYGGSTALSDQPMRALALLFVGRALLGGGESFIITAGQSWGLLMAGPQSAALVIGWAGTALYIGLAAGGPMGGLVSGGWGFSGISVVTIVLPLLTLGVVARLASPPRPAPAKATPNRAVIAAVARPGLAMCFAGFGYSSMAFFTVLLSVDQGWDPSWAPFTAFSVALVLIRLAFGRLPDRLGGARTALIFLALQGAGLAGVMLAGSATVCVLASLVAGLGYAFIYPALGREAVRAVQPAQSGTAVAFYSAFLDLSLALTSPVLGLIAESEGLRAVFLTSALASGIAIAVVLTIPRGAVAKP
jgi:MFS family permease